MIGNNESVQQIRNWLSDFQQKKTNKGGCFLTGPTGLGKTTLINNILTEYEYEIIRIVPSTMPSKKDLKLFIHNTLLSVDIVSCFTKKKSQKVIFLDDIENIGPTQKLCLVEFLQWIYPSKKKHKKISAIEHGIPFIFVGRHTHIKAVQTALKHCIEVQLKAPTIDEQLEFVVKKLKEEKIIYKKNLLVKLIQHCQNDIRQLRMMVDEILSIKVDLLSCRDMDDFLNSYVPIHKENGLLQGTKEILEGSIEFRDSVVLFDTDRYKIPLMIHENYIYLGVKNSKDLESISNIIEILGVYDQIDSYMYKQQYWNLQYLCGSLICGGVSALVRNANRDNIIEPIFTRHMNRVSLATVKRKIILTIQQKINYETSTELYYIKDLLFLDRTSNSPSQEWMKYFKLDESECNMLYNLFS